MRASPLATLLTLLAASPSSAQTVGALPRVAELPASTRAMALGDAYMMDSGHADAVFYHPALLTRASGFGLDVQRWGANATSAAASAAVAWLGGGVGIGVQTLQFAASSAALAAAPAGQDHLFDSGTLGVSERIALLGYARELFGFDVGVVGKLVEERIGSSHDTGALVDVGIATDVGPLTAGLSWRNLGQTVSSRFTEFERPERVTLGVGGYGEQLGPLDVGVSAAVSYASSEWLPSAGVEVGYWPIQGRTFVGRVGVRRVPGGQASPISLGFAFWGDDIVLEWGFQPFDGAADGGTHRFGVRWH